MRRDYRFWTWMIVLLCFLTMNTADALSIAPYDPKRPNGGDPDISKVTDERLVSLYQDTVWGLRTVPPEALELLNTLDYELALADSTSEAAQTKQYIGELIRNWKREFIETPKPLEDADYIVEAAVRALEYSPVDWPMFRAALWAAKAGMEGDQRLSNPIRAALARIFHEGARIFWVDGLCCVWMDLV